MAIGIVENRDIGDHGLIYVPTQKKRRVRYQFQIFKGIHRRIYEKHIYTVYDPRKEHEV